MLYGYSGALALSPERQSTQMSKIKNGGLDQYGAGPFEQQQSEKAGIESIQRGANQPLRWTITTAGRSICLES